MPNLNEIVKIVLNNNEIDKVIFNNEIIWSRSVPSNIDLIRGLLTTSVVIYDTKENNEWVKVTKEEYDSISLLFNNVIKKGNTDNQINNRDSLTSWSNSWIAFGENDIPSFTIDQGHYVIGMITETWNQPNAISKLGYTTTFKGNNITQIGGDAFPSTGGQRDYFILKKPTQMAEETWYPVLLLTQTPNGVSGTNGYRTTDDGQNWLTLPTGYVPKIQLLTTNIKGW